MSIKSVVPDTEGESGAGVSIGLSIGLNVDVTGSDVTGSQAQLEDVEPAMWMLAAGGTLAAATVAAGWALRRRFRP